MSDNDKMMAFGSWLATRKLQHTAELYALSINVKAPIDAVRVKAGHVEATAMILEAFKDLYHGSLDKFMKDYLGQQSDEEKESNEDGTS
jgi:hypothetical protein